MAGQDQYAVRVLLWRRLLQPQPVPGSDLAAGLEAFHRIWRTQLTQHRQPGHPGSNDRLESDFLEEPAVRRGRVDHPELLSDQVSVVCGCGSTQECSLVHAVAQRSLHSAIDTIL